MKSGFSIDLVVCTYNNATLLKKTLTAIERLKVPSHIEWSVLVVNNNCTDNTSSVIEDYTNRGNIPLRTMIEQEQGLNAARLFGVKNTYGKWVAFIDDDCMLSENWIEQAEHFIASHPQCGVFGSRIKLVWEKPPPQYVYHFPFAYAGKNHGESAKRLKAVAGVGMVAKREALKICGWIDHQFLADRRGKQLISGGDMEIALRVGSQYEVWYNPDCKLEHFIPVGRTTKEYLQRMLFGLGASRHNVAALTWRGSYFTWLLYSIIYSFGMLGVGVVHRLQELTGKREKTNWRVALSPFEGWNSAIKDMWSMNPTRRKLLLGCAKKNN